MGIAANGRCQYSKRYLEQHRQLDGMTEEEFETILQEIENDSFDQTSIPQEHTTLHG